MCINVGELNMCTQYTPKIVTAIFEYFTKNDVITYNRKAKAPISYLLWYAVKCKSYWVFMIRILYTYILILLSSLCPFCYAYTRLQSV